MFNEKQLEMINSEQYPLLVFAGPGSGKTTTLTKKISSKLVTKLSDLEKIMVLTFTNNAANDIFAKIENKLGLELKKEDFYTGTFHSMFYKILRENKNILSKYFGFKKVSIIDEDEDIKLFIDLLMINFYDSLNEDEKEELGKYSKENFKKYFLKCYGRYPMDIYYSIIESINNAPKSSQDIKLFVENRLRSKTEERFKDVIFNTIKKYFRNKIDLGIFSFGDILLYMYLSLNMDSEFREHIKHKFNYILVDEFQDTNTIEGNIISLIQNNNTCFIGDPYQSIYGFLGAMVKNIIDKSKEPNMNVIQFIHNYRSTENIVNFTNDIVELFKYQIPNFERCVSVNPENYENKKIRVYEYLYGFSEEINKAIALIKDYLKTSKPNQITILARTNRQFYALEQALTFNRIKYIKRGGRNLYTLSEISICIDVLKMLTKRYTPHTLEKVVSYFDGLGVTTLNKVLNDYYKRTDKTQTIKYIIETSYSKSKPLNLFKEVFLNDFDYTFKSFDEIMNHPSFNALNKIKNNADTVAKLNNIEFNIDYVLGEIKDLFMSTHTEDLHDKLIDYIDNINLINLKDDKDISNKILLSTIHASKGLEWDNVIIIGVQDDIIPHMNSSVDVLDDVVECKNSIEEEKRLFYVAISRAKKELSLLSSAKISQFVEPFLEKDYIKLETKKQQQIWY